jgi:hypothetical protein
VISNFNIHHLDAIEDWVHARGIESYRHEIAEQRAEFHNLGDPITPPPEVYAALTERFKAGIRQNLRGKAFLTRTTEAVRLVYYDVAAQILKQRRQVTPCYGGISNIHLNYNGEVWPCCVLGGSQALGRVREWNYDMPALLHSAQSRQSRRYIAGGNCACPLANQWLNNVLLTPRHMAKALWTLFFGFGRKAGERGGREAGEKERQAHIIRPEDIRVTISGTAPRSALVMHKLGTIPEPEMVELPVISFDSGK